MKSNIENINKLTIKEINDKILLEKININKLYLSHSNATLDNPLKIRFVRRNIARLKTILRLKNTKII